MAEWKLLNGNPYTGLTVQVGGVTYSTHSGALEGTSEELTPNNSNGNMRSNRRGSNGTGLYNYGHVECDCAGSGGLISQDTTSQSHHNHVSSICERRCGYVNQIVYSGGSSDPSLRSRRTNRTNRMNTNRNTPRRRSRRGGRIPRRGRVDSLPDRVRIPPIVGMEAGQVNPYFDAEMAQGGDILCLTGCNWTNQSPNLYECANPPGSDCTYTGNQTFTDSNCGGQCPSGQGCQCVYLGQSDSGGSCGSSWVPYFQTMSYNSCYGSGGASIGPIGCCGLCNPTQPNGYNNC